MQTKSPFEVLIVNRMLPAEPARVFRAFTEPARLAKWFAPGADWRVEVPGLDLRVGGHYTIDMIDPTGAVNRVKGTYTKIDAPNHLAFTWQWDGMPEETLVTIQFRALPGRTELILNHERFLTPESKANHAQGWEGIMSRLPSIL